mmetsp:Transcript_7630/g.18250  ORF Transcript_7630/g.18250 Transcript_7630/m.18250 type:complete len:458 (-) Transcript_7630:73-1446(-)
MASAYAKRMVVPDEFPAALKEYTREALRNLPADVAPGSEGLWLLEFGAEFFGKRAGGEASGPSADLVASVEEMTPEELRERITSIFLEADVDGNGFLDHKEFKEVVRRFTTELGLEVSDMRRIMAEADENEDGAIEYHEFVPAAADMIETAVAKRRFQQAKLEREADAVERSRHFLLHGLSREELEGVLEEMFRQADTDGSGALSRSEFASCLRSSGLGLTRKEINVLMAEVDEDHDGTISYAEFLPLCFNLLVEIVSEEFSSAQATKGESELKEFFTDLFREADYENTGRLRPFEMQELVRQADLGLSHIQISALMSEALVDDDGFVQYETFASDAAAVVASIIDVQTSADKAERLQEMRGGADYDTWNGMSRSAFEGALADALSSADADGSGRVHVAEAKELLTSDACRLSEKEANGIVALAVPDEDFTVEIHALARSAFDVLLHIQEQEAMRGW